MLSEPRARSQALPKPYRSCSACNARSRRPSSKMMMTCKSISMNSVESLRDELESSLKAGLNEAMLTELALRPWLRFDRDFIALAHRHQEPPAWRNNGGAWTPWLMLSGSA